MSSARRLAAVSVALALGLAIAAPADARKFQMSGTWIARTGGIFVPLQFALTAMGSGGQLTHVSMGDLGYALGFPNGPIPGQGVVTGTGSAPATLRIPAHRFVEDAMTLVPCGSCFFMQVTTNVGIDAPYAAATLAPGGGPGSFTWCRTDAACVAGGGMLSTDPERARGLRSGRIVYRAGPNRFGGAMQLGLRRGGSRSRQLDSLRIVHSAFVGVGSTLRAPAAGGPGAPDAPVTAMRYLPRGFATQPTMFPPMGSPILYPGPKVTTMLGTTLVGTGPIFYLPGIAGPMGTPWGEIATAYGFAHTTGTVFVQQTIGSNGDDFFTVMGSDARTALGAGNISLVAGGLTYARDQVASTVGTPSGVFHKITLTLAPPIPSLSPAGGAVAVALLVLAVGYALRRRLG